PLYRSDVASAVPVYVADLGVTEGRLSARARTDVILRREERVTDIHDAVPVHVAARDRGRRAGRRRGRGGLPMLGRRGWVRGRGGGRRRGARRQPPLPRRSRAASRSARPAPIPLSGGSGGASGRAAEVLAQVPGSSLQHAREGLRPPGRLRNLRVEQWMN